MAKLVTFGEIMMRMHMKGGLRFRQGLPGDLDVTFGGAEANTAVAFAQLGGEAAFVSALPRHGIADACLGALRGLGVDASVVLRTGYGRFGIYFGEAGANQRASNGLYDRENSAVSLAPPEGYDWDRIFKGSAGPAWFHITGITPALSENAALASLRAVEAAKAKGLTVSIDLNYRKKLWRWEEGTTPEALAQRVMTGLLCKADVLFTNEEDLDTVLGIKIEQADYDSGALYPEKYPPAAQKTALLFPNLKKIVITLRESFSAGDNSWGAMLFEPPSGNPQFAPSVNGSYAPYRIASIVDRIGGGDAFAGAFIYALLDAELRAEKGAPLRFAAAASCLAHSVWGDFNYTTREEVIALMGGKTSGRINR
jgi:2-dehydro-3-deoxygluconokinase